MQRYFIIWQINCIKPAPNGDYKSMKHFWQDSNACAYLSGVKKHSKKPMENVIGASDWTEDWLIGNFMFKPFINFARVFISKFI